MEITWRKHGKMIKKTQETQRKNIENEIMGKKHKKIWKTHLKKVVEPPDPHSRTFIPGFRTEHISSTPPLSSITVLKTKSITVLKTKSITVLKPKSITVLKVNCGFAQIISYQNFVFLPSNNRIRMIRE